LQLIAQRLIDLDTLGDHARKDLAPALISVPGGSTSDPRSSVLL
jgi:hypothetical protein